MIWNANCDSARPRTKRELLQDLDTWERTQGGHAPNSSASVYQGAQVKDKDFDGAGWSTKHNDSFNDLIAQARRSNKKIADKTRQPSSSAGDAKEADPPHTNGAGGDDPPATMMTDEVLSLQTPLGSATPIDLTSAVRLDDSRSGNPLLSGDEHANVDTIVTSAPAGAHR